MKIFAYVMTYDTGFAPCIAEGKLTLACCKTNLRYKIGNLFSDTEELYLLGLCGKTLAEKCGFSKEYFYTPVYAAKITDVCKTTDYYSFHQKMRCDQVYVYDTKKEKWTIGENNPHHSDSDGKEWDWQTEKDLVYLPRANSKKGELNSVLVSTDFAYLGRKMHPRNLDYPHSFLKKLQRNVRRHRGATIKCLNQRKKRKCLSKNGSAKTGINTENRLFWSVSPMQIRIKGCVNDEIDSIPKGV